MQLTEQEHTRVYSGLQQEKRKDSATGISYVPSFHVRTAALTYVKGILHEHAQLAAFTGPEADERIARHYLVHTLLGAFLLMGQERLRL